MKELWALEGWKGIFEDNCSRDVGNGRELRLWEDKSVENANLKEKFSRLFSICSEKETLLWQGGEMKENLEWAWKIDWRRNLFDWERTQNKS